MKTTQNQQNSYRDPEEVYSRIYGKVLNFLSYRSRTEHEITERLDRYLLRERISPSEKNEIRDRIINSLADDGYLDDSKFLTEYIELVQKSSKPKSILFLKRDLYKKGVSSNLSEKYLSMLAEDYEYRAGLYWGEKRFRTLRIADFEKDSQQFFEAKKKLMDYLQNRGFHFDTIYRVLDEILARG